VRRLIQRQRKRQLLRDKQLDRVLLLWWHLLVVCLIALMLIDKNTTASVPVSQESVVHAFTTKEVVVADKEEESLGEWTITAYCPCEICCGKWALVRPADGTVYGAYGNELIQGIACAAPFPQGTRLQIGDVGEFVVEDTTSAWILERYDNKIVDLYFESHSDAMDFGVQQHVVWEVIR